MYSFVQLVADLLISPAGGLMYHLVLIFSIVGGLQMCVNYMDKRHSEWTRMVLGFGILLSFQLILFLFAILAWRGMIDAGIWLPQIERTSSLLSLLIIVWMWVCPTRDKLADTVTMVIGFFLLSFAVFSGAFVDNTNNYSPADANMIKLIFPFLAMGVTASGIGLLILKKPPGWETGIGQLMIFFLGALSYLIWNNSRGDYPALIRLAELAAFPLLLTLPQRYLKPVYIYEDKGILTSRIDILDIITKVLEKPTPDLAVYELSKNLSGFYKADICCLVEVKELNLTIENHSVFRRENPKEYQIDPIDLQAVPTLVQSIVDRKFLRLHSLSNTSDTIYLAEALRLDSSFRLVLVPIINLPYYQKGVLLISADAKRGWINQQTAVEIQKLVSPLVYFLHLSDQMVNLQNVLRENEALLVSLQTSRLTELGGGSSIVEEYLRIKQLTEEQKSKLETLAMLVSMQQEALASSAARIQILEIDNSNHKTGSIQFQLDEILFQLDELIQPVQTIQKQVDFLLNQDKGDLSAAQRKSVERIGISSERALQINIDILQSLRHQRSYGPTQLYPVTLSDVLDEVIKQVIHDIKHKRIRLRIDLPDYLPDLISEKDTLQDVLAGLLLHAGKVTPEQGEILLQARFEEEIGNDGYVILQITDGGQGISESGNPFYIPASGYPGSNSDHLSTENGPNLSNIYHKVVWIKGRIWMDNHQEKGSTVSILLPISTIASGESEQPGEME